MDNETRAAIAALKASLPPGAADFLDYCEQSLWPVTERCAAKMGLMPLEQRELAIRVVRAAVQQFKSAERRVAMRDMARRPQ